MEGRLMGCRSQRPSPNRSSLRLLLVTCLVGVVLGWAVVPGPAARAATTVDVSYSVTRSATSGGLGSSAWTNAYAALDAQIAQAGAQCINYRATPISSYLTPYGYVFVVTASADCTN